MRLSTALMTAAGFCLALSAAQAPTSAHAEEKERDSDGKYYDAEGEVTYNVAEDGTVDWFTFSGFRRYHSECHVCHGPDAEGSTYAPPLRESLEEMSYDDFIEVVVNGQIRNAGGTEFVMPALGENKNVMCYIDDLYVYLKARADGAVPRGRPAKKEKKSEETREYEDACMSD